MKSECYLQGETRKNIETPKLQGIYDFLRLYTRCIFKAFIFFFLPLVAVTGNVMGQTTYTWTGAAGDGLWTTTNNWSPVRSAPATNDILVFQSVTQTVTTVPTQTIGELIVQTGAIITLQPASTNTLTITSASSVASGCSLTILSNLTVTNTGTITVNGLLDFNGTSVSVPASITVNSGGELRFDGSGAAVFPAASPVISSGTLTIGGSVASSSGTAPTYTNATLQYKTTSSPINTGVEFANASVANLVINNAALADQIVMQGNITVTGTVTGLNITLGILTINGKTLTVTGVANGVNNNGRILGSAAGSTINFTGNAAGAIGTLYFAGTALTNLTMNRTGAGAVLTLGSNLGVNTSLTLTSGIIKVMDTFTFSYTGTVANLSAGSTTSYISFLNAATTNYGFELGPTANIGTYILPIGTTTTTGNPAVSGYRPVKVVWSTSAATNYYKIGYMNDAGTSSSPGTSTDVPSTGNNRAGYIASFVTNVASYGFSMSYLNSDFTSAPVISNVDIFNWNGSIWNPNCQSSNTSGAPNYINQTAFTLASGTLVLGVFGGTDLSSALSGNYYWTGAASTVWENSANWTGPCGGTYPGHINEGDVAIVNSIGTFGSPVITTASGLIRIGQLQVGVSGATVTLNAGSFLGVTGVSGSTSSILLTSGGTVSANPTSTIEYEEGTGCGAYSQVVANSFTYGNLILSDSAILGNSSCKTVSGALNVLGNLTVLSNVSMNLSSSSTTTVSGNVTITGGITGTGDYLAMNGTGMSLSGTTNLSIGPQLIINGTVNLANSMTTTGGLVVNSGKVLSINNGVSLTIPDSLYSPSGFGNNGKVQFYNYGTIQSGSSNGGTIIFDHTQLSNNQLTLNLPSGNGTGGAFNSTSGNQVSLTVLGSEYTFYGSAAVTVSLDNSLTSLTLYNLSLAPGVTNYVYNDYVVLSIASGKTVIVNGGFQNWYTDGITGPGTIQFNSTVNIPSGTATGGTFNHTVGSLVNLTVGTGATANTVTSTAADTVNNLTVTLGTFFAVNSGITTYEAGDLVCNGTIEDGTAGGTLSNIESAVENISGGSTTTHGKVNISTFDVSGGGGGTVSSNGASITWVSGGTFATGGSWNGLTISLSYFITGYVSTSGTNVTLVSGSQFITGAGSPMVGGQIVINFVGYTIASVTSATQLILTSSAGVQPNAYFYEGYDLTATIALVSSSTQLTLTSSVGITPNGYPYSSSVPTSIIVASGSYLDFASATYVKSITQYQSFTNNGTLLFNGSFGTSTGTYAFLTNSNQTYINNGTTTIANNLYIGSFGDPDYFNNNGTLNCSAAYLYIFCVFNNNNGGIAHVTGSGGIVASSINWNQQWNNYPGSWVDDAGPFFETGGTLVCSSATNTVKYDGTGTQIIYPTQYNNLIIAKSAASNNGTLTNGNDTINGILTFTTGNMNAIASGNTVVVTSTGSVSGASQGTGWVNGNLQMPIPAGNTTTNFYIGDSTIYAPINLSMTGASASSITSYTRPTNSPFDPGPSYPSGIEQNHHVLRYWRMTNNGVTFTSYNAVYNFANPQDIVGNTATDPPQYVVRQYDPVSWIVTTIGTRNLTNTQALAMTTIGVGGNLFSDYEIGIDSINPLPITLLSFTAKAEESDVVLNWTTASEINNDYFIIEKTVDAVNYSTVGKVPGAGTSTVERDYSLIDPSPYPGVSYYRLKQTDYDGKFTYSQLQAVDFNKSGSGEVTIFPNPSSDKIYFGTSQGNQSTFMLHIYDMKGSEAIAPASITFSDGNLISIDISSLANGVYTIQLISNDRLQQEKFIKN